MRHIPLIDGRTGNEVGDLIPEGSYSATILSFSDIKQSTRKPEIFYIIIRLQVHKFPDQLVYTHIVGFPYVLTMLKAAESFYQGQHVVARVYHRALDRGLPNVTHMFVHAQWNTLVNPDWQQPNKEPTT